MKWKRAKIKMEMEPYDKKTLTDVSVEAQAAWREQRFKDFNE